jgi:hypothetical protein
MFPLLPHWHWRVLGPYSALEKIHCVADPLVPSRGTIYPMRSVVFHCRADIPAIEAMGGPRSTVIWFFVHYYLCPWRRKWCLIVFEQAVQLYMCQQFRVEAGLA